MNLNSYLLGQLAKGDHHSFKELYERYYNRLFSFALCYVRIPEVAEDIVSEIFLDLWKRKEAATNIECFETFIYRSVKNSCLNQLGSGYSRYTQLVDDFTPVSYRIELFGPDDQTSYNELNDAINKAIAGLPERCRVILKMVKEDNLKYKQIAEILDISPRTVETQVTIALKKIREEIAAFLNVE